MNKPSKACFLLVFFTILAYLPAFAQDDSNQAASRDQKIKPIVVNYATVGGLRYFTDDIALSSHKDFEDVIYPLRDFEATRLLKKSESSEDKGKLFGLVGFAGLVTGLVGLLTTTGSQQTPFWITAVGGGLSIDIGGLFQTEAQTAKFNCVQRYNRFARGEEQILPQTPQDEKSLLNFNQSGDSSMKKTSRHKKTGP